MAYSGLNFPDAMARAGSYKIFGNHLVISRIWMFIIGIFPCWAFTNYSKHYLTRDTCPDRRLGIQLFTQLLLLHYQSFTRQPGTLLLDLGTGYILSVSKERWFAFTCISGLLLSTGALTKLPFILYLLYPFHTSCLKL